MLLVAFDLDPQSFSFTRGRVYLRTVGNGQRQILILRLCLQPGRLGSDDSIR